MFRLKKYLRLGIFIGGLAYAEHFATGSNFLSLYQKLPQSTSSSTQEKSIRAE